MRDDAAPADTSLRVGLALLATSLAEIQDAVAADAAEEDALASVETPSLGNETYAALQRVLIQHRTIPPYLTTCHTHGMP